MNVNATFVPSGETRGRYGPAKPEPPLRPSHVSTGFPIGFPAARETVEMVVVAERDDRAVVGLGGRGEPAAGRKLHLPFAVRARGPDRVALDVDDAVGAGRGGAAGCGHERGRREAHERRAERGVGIGRSSEGFLSRMTATQWTRTKVT